MTPTTLPAVRLPSHTRKLYFVSEAYLAIVRSMALHGHLHELRELAEFQQTFPFSDGGEPTLNEYWRAFQAWRKGGGWR